MNTFQLCLKDLKKQIKKKEQIRIWSHSERPINPARSHEKGTITDDQIRAFRTPNSRKRTNQNSDRGTKKVGGDTLDTKIQGSMVVGR